MVAGKTREAAVAGSFYPDDPQELREVLHHLLTHAPVPDDDALSFKAMVVPHAGYVFSGPIAASAYVCLKHRREHVSSVTLIGPAHYVGFKGIASVDYDWFRTPLGDIPVNKKAVAALQSVAGVTCLNRAHDPEHCLEVNLPFLQYVLEDFKLTPLLVGEATSAQVSKVMDSVWGDDENIIVISSDLSHYLSYDQARGVDAATIQCILGMNEESLESEQACGRLPIQGLIRAAKERGLQPKLLDARNSGDTAGPKNRVVGYASFLFS